MGKEKTQFKKGSVPWNKNKRILLDLEKINKEHHSGKSIIDIGKELGVSDRLIRIRMKENGFTIRSNKPTAITKNKISQTLKSKGIRPKIIHKGKTPGSFKKGHDTWNKDKQTGQKNWKHRTFTEETIKKIKEARSKQITPVKDTSIELKMQKFLKQLGIEFYTHQYIKEIEHSYQCDIMIPLQKGISRKTIIECYGDYWHNRPFGNPVDTLRCNELREQGWRVLTFWGSEIRPMQLNDLRLKL